MKCFGSDETLFNTLWPERQSRIPTQATVVSEGVRMIARGDEDGGVAGSADI